jgi:topoisomerase-4 subunit B
MDPKKRTLLRVEVNESEDDTKSAVDALMGTKPELRFRFIQERAVRRSGRAGYLI